MPTCTNAVDLWPLFWVAVALGITVYNCLSLYLEHRYPKDED